MLLVTGHLHGHHVHAQLDDAARLTGSPQLVRAIRDLIEQDARVGIAGIITGPASLAEDRIARATLLAPLDHGTGRLAGDPPRIDAIPAGAEA